MTVFDIAGWFLSKEPMTHKKLQKLCYYAQGWHYALYDAPLFDADFEAWAHGPVCRALWERYNGYKAFEEIPQGKPVTFNKDTDEFLERVWETYGELDGSRLEYLTHRETPWIKARNGLPDYRRCTNVIDPADMETFYKTQYIGDGVGE